MVLRRPSLTARIAVVVVAVMFVAGSRVVLAPSPVLGKVGVWTVTASPLTLNQNVATEVSLTVTAILTTQIGCVAFQIPSGFTVVSARGPSPWILDPIDSGPPTHVTFHVTKDSQRLTNGASAVFKVTVIPTKVSVGAWTASAYEHFDTSKDAVGPSLPLNAFIIVPTPTPTPRPTPPPTPAPTATPTATPGRTPAPSSTPAASPATSPSSAPTPGGPPTGPPADPTLPPSPDPSIGGSPDPSNEPSPSPTPGIGGVVRPSLSPGTPTSRGPTSPGWASIPLGGSGGSVSPVAIANLLGSLGVFEWLVPSALIAAPGLLLILTVLAQMGGALAWLPVVRRRIGGFGLRTTHRRGGTPTV